MSKETKQCIQTLLVIAWAIFCWLFMGKFGEALVISITLGIVYSMIIKQNETNPIKSHKRTD